MSLRDEHFKRLNAYRNSREYVDYATAIGNAPKVDPDAQCKEHGCARWRCDADHAAPAELPTLLGVRWVIDSSIYNEFLEILPPMRWRGGTFLMREFTFGTITAKYTKEGDRYYCEFVDASKDRP